jgi:hypothetical protein
MTTKTALLASVLLLLLTANLVFALTAEESFPYKIDLGLGQQEGIVDTQTRHISQYFTGFINIRCTWVKPLPQGTIIRFIWAYAKDNAWTNVLDLTVTMDGTQDVAFSKVYRTGTTPMSVGYWRVAVYINDKILDDMNFLVK